MNKPKKSFEQERAEQLQAERAYAEFLRREAMNRDIPKDALDHADEDAEESDE